MKGLERLGQLVETDVLVIGSGIAGAFAAIKARETGASVTVVDRSYAGKSGASFITSGAIHHFHPEEDNLDDALK